MWPERYIHFMYAPERYRPDMYIPGRWVTGKGGCIIKVKAEVAWKWRIIVKVRLGNETVMMIQYQVGMIIKVCVDSNIIVTVAVQAEVGVNM